MTFQLMALDGSAVEVSTELLPSAVFTSDLNYPSRRAWEAPEIRCWPEGLCAEDGL